MINRLESFLGFSSSSKCGCSAVSDLRIALRRELVYNVGMITTETRHGFPVQRVETQLGTLEVSQYGAHVLGWTPSGGRPVFYMSGAAVYAEGKALRGGIPICWPWFGKHPTEPKSNPSHGLARISMWQFEHGEESAEGEAKLKYALRLPEQPVAEYELHMRRDTLEIVLRTLQAPADMAFSAALHSYFAVSDYEHVNVTGLENAPFTEYADDAAPHSEAPLIPAGHIDRIYYPVPAEREISIEDETWGRLLCISRSGSRSCVVWNPGEKGAAGIADVEPGTSHSFLAVEAAVVPDERLSLHVGESHEMRMVLSVHAL